MKINLSKIWNVFFNALIACTLLLCLFMMTKYFFFKDNKQLELGNLSDWVSSLSTLGTLVVAYKAFKAAPNWLSQKFDEESLQTGLSINSIIENEYKHAIIKISNHFFNNKMSDEIHALHYHNTLIDPKRIDRVNESLIKINDYITNNIFTDISRVSAKLDSELTKLNMLEWNITPEKNIILNSLHEKINKIKKNENDYKLLLSGIFKHTSTGLFDYKTQKNEIDNLVNIRDMLISLEREENILTREVFVYIKEYGRTKSFRSYFHRIIE
ncbi:hypothetical protein CI789_12060 [Erwinia persicina]|nr:hypothetical protein CI789_12060 [Erwinia persicina]